MIKRVAEYSEYLKQCEPHKRALNFAQADGLLQKYNTYRDKISTSNTINTMSNKLNTIKWIIGFILCIMILQIMIFGNCKKKPS